MNISVWRRHILTHFLDLCYPLACTIFPLIRNCWSPISLFFFNWVFFIIYMENQIYYAKLFHTHYLLGSRLLCMPRILNPYPIISLEFLLLQWKWTWSLFHIKSKGSTKDITFIYFLTPQSILISFYFLLYFFERLSVLGIVGEYSLPTRECKSESRKFSCSMIAWSCIFF